MEGQPATFQGVSYLESASVPAVAATLCEHRALPQAQN